MADEDRPLAMLAMFPLSVVLLPFELLPLQLFEPRYLRLLEDCRAGTNEFGVVLISRGSEVGGGDQRFSVATVAHIDMATPGEWGRWLVLARGVRRVRVREWVAEEPYPLAAIEELPAEQDLLDESVLASAEASVRSLRTLLAQLGGPVDLNDGAFSIDDGLERSWRIAHALPLNPLDGQKVLEIDDPNDRMRKIIEFADSLREDLELMDDLERPPEQ